MKTKKVSAKKTITKNEQYTHLYLYVSPKLKNALSNLAKKGDTSMNKVAVAILSSSVK